MADYMNDEDTASTDGDNATAVVPALGHFDYSQLPREDAVALRKLACRIRESFSNYAIETGGDLVEAKRLAKRGTWMDWLSLEFNMSSRTAENYMNVFRFVKAHPDLFPEVDGKFEINANISVVTLMELARNTNPPNVVEEILGKLVGGAKLQLKEVKERLGEAKECLGVANNSIQSSQSSTSSLDDSAEKEDDKSHEDKPLENSLPASAAVAETGGHRDGPAAKKRLALVQKIYAILSPPELKNLRSDFENFIALLREKLVTE